MPTTYAKGFATASTDAGATAVSISSTEEEPKTLTAVRIGSVITNTVVLTGYLEREKIIDTVTLTAFAAAALTRDIAVNLEIPPGQTFSLIITPASAGSQGTVYGRAEYEIRK